MRRTLHDMMRTRTKTTVYVTDDHGLVREGLCAVIEGEPDLEVVGLGASGRDAVQAARELHPDVIVMDVAKNDMNGMEATRIIKRVAPECRVVAISSHGDQRHVVGMLKAGACGYVLKSEAFGQLRLAIAEAMAGNVYLSPSVSGAIVDVVRGESDEAGLAILSEREREIVQLVAEGYSSGAIGSRLNITPSTVETHRRNVLRKLQLHNVAELTRFAIREGLTHLDG
jgi:DNA-binding NarL/FixJ family response regulator